MVIINTVEQARAVILGCIEITSREEILREILWWNNTEDNDIDHEGNVYVANPQTFHQLNDENMIEFATFLIAA